MLGLCKNINPLISQVNMRFQRNSTVVNVKSSLMWKKVAQNLQTAPKGSNEAESLTLDIRYIRVSHITGLSLIFQILRRGNEESSREKNI